jgi:hypothetical protein
MSPFPAATGPPLRRPFGVEKAEPRAFATAFVQFMFGREEAGSFQSSKARRRKPA